MQAYDQGNEEDELFVQNLALFLTSFLREHLTLIEGSSALRPQLISALQYLVKISYVQNSGAAVNEPADRPRCQPLACPTVRTHRGLTVSYLGCGALGLLYVWRECHVAAQGPKMHSCRGAQLQVCHPVAHHMTSI